jgi:hypothetical protein
MQFFSLNLLHRELLAVCRWISSISVSFGDKFNRKWPTKDEYRNFTILRQGKVEQVHIKSKWGHSIMLDPLPCFTI